MSESKSEREDSYPDNPQVTPQYSSPKPGSSQKSKCSNKQGVFFPPPTPSTPTPPTPHPPPPPHPPPRRNMVDDIKLPVSKGTGSEDPKNFWFLCEDVWTMKQINDENINKEQLITML